MKEVLIQWERCARTRYMLTNNSTAGPLKERKDQLSTIYYGVQTIPMVDHHIMLVRMSQGLVDR